MAKKTKPPAKKVKTAKATKKVAASAKRSKARSSWFDAASHKPLIAEQARRLKTFLAAMADGVIDKAEVEAQEERLIAVMREVEPLLGADLHARVTRLLCELTAYDLMQILHSFHEARPKSVFQG